MEQEAMRYFVFIDETGTALQDEYFGLGCLIIPHHKIGEYNTLLQQKYDQILGMIKRKEDAILPILSEAERKRYDQGRKKPYEMKFKNVNTTTYEGYQWLISQYFKCREMKFCALVINRWQYPFPSDMTYFDAYLHQLTMLLTKHFSEHDEFVILPDSITVPGGRNYESELTDKLKMQKRKCFGVCRIESHSSVFLQMVDCLIGAVVYDTKKGKNGPKISVIQKIKTKLNIEHLSENLTLNTPNKFSVWNYSSSS